MYVNVAVEVPHLVLGSTEVAFHLGCKITREFYSMVIGECDAAQVVIH